MGVTLKEIHRIGALCLAHKEGSTTVFLDFLIQLLTQGICRIHNIHSGTNVLNMNRLHVVPTSLSDINPCNEPLPFNSTAFDNYYYLTSSPIAYDPAC